jgi:hypothetical protein
MNNKKWLYFGLLAAVSVSACATPEQREQKRKAKVEKENGMLQSHTSGLIGCPPSEISISDHSPATWNKDVTWSATCRGQKFYCNRRKCERELKAQ